MTRTRILQATRLALLTLLAAGAAIAEQDHLIGLKGKDLLQTEPPPSVSIVSPLMAGQCEIKKAQFTLIQAEKNGEDDPRGAQATNFVCYRAKCPDVSTTPVAADTQFGSVMMESKKVQLLCLPADADVCGDGQQDQSEFCDGDDDSLCPGACQSDCTCLQCDGGVIVAGACWYLGAPGEHCGSVCANQNRGYSTATETIAGSAGAPEFCALVLGQLGQTFSQTTACADGLGCHYDTNVNAGIHCASPPTDLLSSASGARRACACQ